MTTPLYDEPGFFAAYSQLPRSVEGLAGAPEWPSLRALLPPLDGRDVLDLGCGFGWFCRWAAQAGAARVVGMDVSARMLARAAADTDTDDTNDRRIVYERADLDTVALPADTFDLAYSSLAFHYLVGLDRLLTEVAGALRPGGSLVFSVEHPVYTAPRRPGFVTSDAGTPVWPLDGYLDEGERVTDWLAPGVVKRHRTIGTYVCLLRDAGFTLTDLVEWGPSAEQVAEHPTWAPEVERPPFLLVAARRD